MTLRLCLLRQVDRKWEEEEHLDITEEEGEKEVEEVVEEMVERGILVGVWHSWYFPKSGHGWGWISGPANHCFLESGGKNREGTQASPASLAGLPILKYAS